MRCPYCHSEDVEDYGSYIHCPNCDLDFDKTSLETVDEEDIMSQQDLNVFVKAFDLDSKKKRRKFLDSFEEEDENNFDL